MKLEINQGDSSAFYSVCPLDCDHLCLCMDGNKWVS